MTQSFIPMSRSDSMNTGVWKRSARSNDCTAKSKHSLGFAGKSRMCLVSPCDAYAQAKMSPCWVRVGIPVEGPVRCTSMITAGISA